jgi:AraC family transcriptional regulator of adaptative response/methylated-DNA-[protein]-cysteine methyltransferase
LDDRRWQAVVDRDPAAGGSFFYSVRTTGVYCRPGCPARLPKRSNVRFHATCQEAAAAGFRPCKRCRPTQSGTTDRHSAAVAHACRMLGQADHPLDLAALARAAGLSPFHFHRVFKAVTGLTPKRYAAAQRARRLREQIPRSGSVTDAIYAAGYSSTSRFYRGSQAALGMSPTRLRNGGSGVTIRFAIGQCWLGAILVAASDVGVCAILLGDDPETLIHQFQDTFPKAELAGGDASFEQLVARVIGHVESPSLGMNLPLDIRGTAFQQRVWQALQQIPPGSSASYAEIASRIGQPQSVRAVAGACAANRLAVAIPCHRVVRTDGSPSGYRWGIERKGALLRREQQAPAIGTDR